MKLEEIRVTPEYAIGEDSTTFVVHVSFHDKDLGGRVIINGIEKGLTVKETAKKLRELSKRLEKLENGDA